MVVVLDNIQSIRHAEYIFEDVGLYQLKGDNSNGKSILIKALSMIVNMRMLDSDVRESMINDACDEGQIAIEYHGKLLVARLNRERNRCVVILQRESGEKVVRTFRDGGIPELISEFGFCCYDKNSICLQIFETFGQMPFVNTSNAVNNEIVKSVTEDFMAKSFLTSFKEFTHPLGRAQLKRYNELIEQKEQILSVMRLYDYKMYDAYYEKLKYYADILKKIKPVHIAFLNIPPKVDTVAVNVPKLEKLRILPKKMTVSIKVPKLFRVPVIKTLDPLQIPENLIDGIKKMSDVRKGVCPTCGRLLIDKHMHVEGA